MVTVTTLAIDGRANASTPMNVYWIPVICENPPSDLYDGCYPAFGARFPTHADLTSLLTAGTAFTFKMPADTITSHVSRPGSGGAYGLVYVFNAACAGHLESTPGNSASPASLPFGCFDANENAVDSDGFVFGFTRIYSFADGRTNTNPAMAQLAWNGVPVDVAAGITVSHCSGAKCPSSQLDANVPASNDEPDPSNVMANGGTGFERIWVDYYVSGGTFTGDAAAATLLFDGTGQSAKSKGVGYVAPSAVGDQRLWAVVHDNRGGVAWLSVNLHVN
jgi:hypothetical protein